MQVLLKQVEHSGLHSKQRLHGKSSSETSLIRIGSVLTRFSEIVRASKFYVLTELKGMFRVIQVGQ